MFRLFCFFIFFLVFLLYLDSGLESDYIQDDMLIGGSDKSPTVEDGTQQDETKNGHLGNILFFYDVYTYLF